MANRNVFSNNFALIGSLCILILVIGSAILLYNPPKFSKLLNNTKPGVFLIDAPREVELNKLFTVKIEVDTQKQAVNAVGVIFRFNPNKLELITLDTSQSFCQFYPEKKFDNDQGLITLSCGSPHPGVSGKNVLMELEFLPKAIGSTNLSLDPNSKILMSDGKGTNILSEYPQHQLNILNSL